MWPDSVVKGLYIGEYIGLGADPSGIVLEVDKLALETAEEIFRYSVVIGIALVGHALVDSIGPQLFPESGRRVLDAPVTVEDERLRWLATAYCHVERFQS